MIMMIVAIIKMPAIFTTTFQFIAGRVERVDSKVWLRTGPHTEDDRRWRIMW